MKKLRNSACESQRSPVAALSQLADFIAWRLVLLRFLRCRRRTCAIAVRGVGLAVPVSITGVAVAIAVAVATLFRLAVPVVRVHARGNAARRSVGRRKGYGRDLRLAFEGESFGAVYAGNFRENREGLGDDLVHVVIAIRRQTPDEMHARCLVRQGLIPLIELSILRFRNWVIRVTFCHGVFVDDARLRMLLAGEMLELGHARVGVVVWIVDDGDGLEL